MIVLEAGTVSIRTKEEVLHVYHMNLSLDQEERKDDRTKEVQ
jgi:hypothetical protein